MHSIAKKVSISIATFCTAITFLSTPSIASDFYSSSKDQIQAALTDNPNGQQSASITLRQGINTKRFAKWADENNIQILDVVGTIRGKQRHYQVFANHLFAFEGTLEQKLNSYVAENLSSTIDNITQQITSGKAKNKQSRVNDLNGVRGNPVFWQRATIVGSYKSLDALIDDKRLSSLTLSHDNRAELTLTANNHRLPLSLLKRPIPGTSQTLGLDSKSVEKANSSLAISTISCGPGGDENNCPPDTHWLPHLGSWYTRIQLGENNTLYGWQYTPMQWNSTEIQAFTASSLPECSPYVIGADAQCGFPGFKQSNVTYVPDSSFEIEAEILNPSCFNRGSNAQTNFENACFEYFWAFSNYPTPYIDTPIFDEPFIWNSTIGTVNAGSLVPFKDYYVYYHFAAQNEFISLLTFTPVKIRGQIGSKFDPCVFGYPLCVFGIDTTKLGEALLLPVY